MVNYEYSVRSVETVFRIIETLDELGAAGISELAAEADVSNSTVHKHVNTLRSMGYVKKDGTTYSLTLHFLGIGIRARAQYDIVRTAKSIVDDLSTRTELITSLVVLEDGYGVFTYRSPPSVSSPGSLPAIGDRTYLQTTAAGKAMLSKLEWDAVRSIIDDVGLPDPSDRTGSSDRDPKQELPLQDYSTSRRGRTIFHLRRELQSIQEQGYALERDEHGTTHPALAAPITIGGTPVAALSVSAYSRQRTQLLGQTPSLATQVTDAAADVEAKISRLET
ncbi:helix-turn-helix domain-containing protein [Natronolimnobius sp. AArcel1]|uniref:IclR family transcriptional regulator n=1 Tax=Natronolimnobius sp. AArcel1 TaxID=1679093 RepID=UPI0013EBACBB|nr:IclR family transcriptional regulator C-terminal domain-containing protein [Natronolimnobius sp. AArcel1]NGM70480.1 helix-turn-helix domain-containing protein [Natronolimnobius sp. AArcel1]